MNDAYGLFCLRWEAAKGEENETDVNVLEGESIGTAARKRFGVIPLVSTLSTVQVVWANILVYPFTTELLWSYRRLYTNKNVQKSGTRKKRAHEQDKAIERG